MSAEYEGKDPLELAKQAEIDLNSRAAKEGHSGSDSILESGVDASVENKFPGAKVTYGSAASGQGDNRDIPVEEGGDVQKDTGRLTKAGDFDQGEAGEGPEDILKKKEIDMGGDDSVTTV